MKKSMESPNYRNTRSKFNTSHCVEEESLNGKKCHTTGDEWKQKGNKEFSKGNYQGAIAAYTQAIEISPGESLYYSNRAKSYKMIQNLPKALKDSEQACELDDKNIKAHYICGCVLAEMGKSDESKLKKAEMRLGKALRLCTSLGKSNFQQEISTKMFRLRKLMWYLQQKKEVEGDEALKKILRSSLQNKLIAQQKFQELWQRQEIRETKRKCLQLPSYLTCIITLQLMKDPVCTQFGFTYEKESLEEHFKINGFIDPLTRKPLSSKPYPNVAISQAVSEYLNDNPWAFEHQSTDNYLNIQF